MAWQGYKVVAKLGEGGMATVYKAIQESLQRPVAIKILAANLKENPEILERFEKESLIIAQLTHPHIIHVIDRGVTSKGRPYFVMEFVEGMTLEEAINRGKLDFTRKLEVLVQICKALGYAHKNGVIHRDIKPANILLDAELQARVVDFGIAHFYDAARGAHLQVASDQILGTSAYMAPELHRSADAATVRSDLYALGIVMYELFTGVQPQGEIPPPTQFEPDLPSELSELILSCVADNPRQRPRSADDIKNALLHLLRGGHLSADQKHRAETEQPGLEGKFELLDVLKEDSFSTVYLYEDAARRKLITVKKLPPGVPGVKEHRLLSRLKHDHVVAILGVSSDEAQTTLITEYLAGGSLAEQLLATPEPTRVMDWARQIAEALAFAHRNRIVHGNLRPSNVFFDEAGQVKVGDFGLKPHYRGGSGQNWYEHPGLQGAALDLFALGVVCCQALTGQPPQFRSGRLMRSRRFTELHPRIQEVVSRLLESQEDRRYPSTEVVVAELRGVLRQLADQAAVDQQLALDRKVAEMARETSAPAARPRRRRVSPWRWLGWGLLALIVIEEATLGHGRQALPPLWAALEQRVLQWRDGGAYREWSDRASRLLE